MLHPTDLLPETQRKICLIQKSAMALEHDERQATLKLKSGPDVEVCSTLPCQPAEENLKILICSTHAEHCIKDISCAEVVASEDKRPVISGCTVVMEELRKLKTLMPNKSHCYNNSLETITDQSKTVIVKDKECNPEGQGPSVVDVKVLTECGLYQLKEDDKDMLRETFISHSSNVEEKHVCISHGLEQNAEQINSGCTLAECFNESAILSSDRTDNLSEAQAEDGESSDRTDNLSEAQAEDGEKDTESAVISADLNKNIFEVPARNGERESELESNTCCSFNYLDVRLESLNGRKENPSEVRAEDGEKDRESVIISSDQDENIFEVRAGNGERNSGLESSTWCSINCSDVRLESSSGRTENPSDIQAEDAEKEREYAIIPSDQDENIFDVPAGNGVRESGLKSSTCYSINCLDVRLESLSGMIEDPSEVPAEDGKKDKESDIISSGQNENILEVPAQNGERDGGLKSSTWHSINCLDVRLESLNGRTENPTKFQAEDGEKDRASAVISSDQDENIFEAPAGNGERGITIESSTCRSINYMDVRLESVSGRTHLSGDSSVETVITKLSSTVTFLRDSSDGGEFMHCGPEADSNGLTSCDNRVDESSEITSHNKVEICEVKGQSEKGGTEFPNPRFLERDINENTHPDSLNDFPLQKGPFSALEMDQTLAAVQSSFESTSLTDASIISPVVANASLARKHIIGGGCAGQDTNPLEHNDVDERMPGSFYNHALDWQVPVREREVAAKHKSTFDAQNSINISHLRKDSDGACKLNEKLLTDSVMMNSATLEKSLGSNIFATGLVDCDATKSAERQSQRSVVMSGFADDAVFQINNGEMAVDAECKSASNGQNSHISSPSGKDSNGTRGLTEKLLSDALALNCATSQGAEAINISSPAMAESNITKNVQNQKSAGHLVSQIGSDVSSSYGGQNLHELSDVSGQISGNNAAAELPNYTYSGLIPLSGSVSYAEPVPHSGSVPFSGSISLRSDSSTTSTRSFAFPVLASEWNSSPVKMVQPDSRYIRKKRRWRFFSCCRKPST